jgi:hypothetical protein
LVGYCGGSEELEVNSFLVLLSNFLEVQSRFREPSCIVIVFWKALSNEAEPRVQQFFTNFGMPPCPVSRIPFLSARYPSESHGVRELELDRARESWRELDL